MKLRNFLAVLIVLVGLVFFLWPTLSGLYTQWLAQQAVDQVHQMMPPETTISETAPIPTTALPEQTVPATTEETVPPTQSEMEVLYENILDYNQQIFQEGQVNFRDPFSYQTPPFDLTAYGFENNVIGTIWIPRLELELPLYLGATNENMALGAAVLGETSLPASGDNTNVVIAAHRGYGGAPMFRDIQLIQLDDKITITTPWETLVYRVCQLEIITPDNTSAVLIQPGRNMLTLLTCHPYTQNYQRYLVRAELSEDEQSTSKETDLLEAKQTFDEGPRQVIYPGEDGKTTHILVEPVSIQPSPAEPGSESDSNYSNQILWLEQVVPWIVLALLAILAVIKFRMHRKEKKS